VLIFILDEISKYDFSQLSPKQIYILKDLFFNLLNLLLELSQGIYMNLMWKFMSNTIIRIGKKFEFDSSFQLKLFEKFTNLSEIPSYIPIYKLDNIVLPKNETSLFIIGSPEKLSIESSNIQISRRQQHPKWDVGRSSFFSLLNVEILNQ
jgi:hypothetical protein